MPTCTQTTLRGWQVSFRSFIVFFWVSGPIVFEYISFLFLILQRSTQVEGTRGAGIFSRRGCGSTKAGHGQTAGRWTGSGRPLEQISWSSTRTICGLARRWLWCSTKLGLNRGKRILEQRLTGGWPSMQLRSRCMSLSRLAKAGRNRRVQLAKRSSWWVHLSSGL